MGSHPGSWLCLRYREDRKFKVPFFARPSGPRASRGPPACSWMAPEPPPGFLISPAGCPTSPLRLRTPLTAARQTDLPHPTALLPSVSMLLSPSLSSRSPGSAEFAAASMPVAQPKGPGAAGSCAQRFGP